MQKKSKTSWLGNMLLLLLCLVQTKKTYVYNFDDNKISNQKYCTKNKQFKKYTNFTIC